MKQEKKLSDHPARMVVPSEHRESRDLSFGLSALTSTLTKNASASPLSSTLTKTKDLKSFIINTYKKGVGVPLRLLSLPAAPRLALTSHESQFPSPCDRSMPSVN